MTFPVSDLVRREVERQYGGPRAAEVLGVLEATGLPFLDVPERARERDRVQLAILVTAGGDVERLREAARRAAIDWRDTLVGAALANADWPEVLRRAGYPVP